MEKLRSFKERLKIDDETKTVTAVAIDGDCMKHYKKYIAGLQAISRDGSSFAKFSIQYGKLNENEPIPTKYMDRRTLQLPIIGNLLHIGPLGHQSPKSLAEKYGPVMLLQLGSRQVMVVTSADAAHEALREKDVDFGSKSSSGIA
ncbi:hypothetical protein ACH5RR_036340 [Cinchona calisaya]|uniref:Bet v I/Major latex protein domain-containing protein n=1 Tax=Cinchona calisaya TaxID=153742 RepID=A0ABD2Y2W5_9GENT